MTSDWSQDCTSLHDKLFWNQRKNSRFRGAELIEQFSVLIFLIVQLKKVDVLGLRAQAGIPGIASCRPPIDKWKTYPKSTVA